MAHDVAHGVTVLFGGYNNNSVNGETWGWNGAIWTHVNIVGPSARCYHAMAYDAARGDTVLFGGYAVTGNQFTYNGETWEWNGTAWTQRAVSGPSPRAGHAMAYDSARGVSVLFGGYSPTSGGYSGETWEWNGTAWTQQNVSSPPPRNFHAMAYDSARGVTVLFGGLGFDNSTQQYLYFDDTWEWDGTAWTQRAVTGPSPRFFHAMAYDSVRGVTVLFGGESNPFLSGETWEWNGTAWTQRVVSGPSPRYGHAMAYDAARSETLLFGGFNSDYNGETWGLGVLCYANCDASTVTPILNANDFACFLYMFAIGDSYANCDGSTVPPVLNANDFTCFLNKFAAGCT
jgi:hypothetical protein